MARKAHLTMMERTFAKRMAATGDKAYAATVAGYKHPSKAAHRLLGNDDVQSEMRRVARLKLQTEGAETGVRVLLEIANDAKQPGGTRVRAALELVKHSGVSAVENLDEKDLADMKPDEIAKLLDRARRELALRMEGAKVIDAAPIEQPADEPEPASIFG